MLAAVAGNVDNHTRTLKRALGVTERPPAPPEEDRETVN